MKFRDSFCVVQRGRGDQGVNSANQPLWTSAELYGIFNVTAEVVQSPRTGWEIPADVDGADVLQ